jgi:hypothetical protein
MQSSAGSRNLQLRALVWLGSIAAAAFVVALLLAFASTTVPNVESGGNTVQTIVVPRFVGQPRAAPSPAPVATSVPLPEMPQRLWPLLTRWAYGLDASALLGLVAVLIVGYSTRRRRGART